MSYFASYIQQGIELRQKLLEDPTLQTAYKQLVQLGLEAFSNGHGLYTCGNGGSAADAMHIAGELSGRYLMDRKPLPAEYLNPNTIALTAMANDFGYNTIFSRMVEAKMKPGDLLLALTTSGRSPNIIEALKTANENQIKSVVITGEHGGEAGALAGLHLAIPSSEVPLIQEATIMLAHSFCSEWEQALFT